MIKLLTFIILLCYLFYVCDCGTLPASQLAEQTLITTLFINYSKNIKPESELYVDITATIQQIVAIDEKLQIMTSSSFISQSWIDVRLSWTPGASNNNLQVVMVPVKTLWIPDTMIINSADTSGYFTVSDYSLASVEYTGQVYMILPALTIKTRCNMNVRYFPFDRQMCSINLTSWAQGYNRLVYTENSSQVLDISEYSEHALWRLNGTDVVIIKAADRSPLEDTYNDIISIQLYLQRKPLFFIMNGIFACLILNCVTLLSFTLPFGSQIGLCMVCFMTYSVYSLNFSNLFPQQSDYLMMITLYFLLSICWTLISMAWFVLCNHFISKAEMPKTLYAFCGLLQRASLCCFPPAKKDDKTDKTIDVIVENGDCKNSEKEESTKATSTPKLKCVPCQKLFTACLRKRAKVESVDKEKPIPDEATESGAKNLTEVTPAEAVASESITEKPEQAKPKCDFCTRCEACQADFDKDKTKGKNKKDIEARCSALNYFVLLWIFLFMFTSDLAVWILMSK